MTSKVLEFERPIVELEGKIRELKLLSGSSREMAAEIERLEEKARKLQAERFAALTPWEQVQLAKHPDRPYTLDYIAEIMTDFVELRGDRAFADDDIRFPFQQRLEHLRNVVGAVLIVGIKIDDIVGAQLGGFTEPGHVRLGETLVALQF